MKKAESKEEFIAKQNKYLNNIENILNEFTTEKKEIWFRLQQIKENNIKNFENIKNIFRAELYKNSANLNTNIYQLLKKLNILFDSPIVFIKNKKELLKILIKNKNFSNFI